MNAMTPARFVARIALMLGMLACGVCHANTWHWANPLPQGNGLRAVAYGNGKWIGVGSAGSLVSSVDGVSWTGHAPIGAGSDLNGIEWSSHGWIAVGSDGAILTSTDGDTWTLQASSTWDTLRDVACSPDMCVVAGDYGQLVVSSDAINWWQPLSMVWNSLYHVAWNGQMWVAVGYGGIIVTSSDGVNWTQRASNVPVCFTDHEPCNLVDIGWNGSIWLAVGLAGAEAWSSDGISWTQINNPVDLFESIAWDGSRWVVVGSSGIYTSTDAQTWHAEFTGGELTGVTSHAGTSVAVGSVGTLLSSPGDGNWTPRESSVASPNFVGVNSVAQHAGTWVAVGDDGQMLSSADGAHWGAVPGFDSSLLFTRVIWQGAWFALGSNQVFRSTDAIVWNAVASLPQRLQDVVSDGQKYIVVGDYGTIGSSPDGINWTQIDSYNGSGPHLNGVTWDNGLWTAVGGNIEAAILVSADGIQWTEQPINFGGGLERVAAHLGRRIATARLGAVFVSDDGATWAAQDTDARRALFTVHWLAGEWVATGEGGTVIHSSDGSQWLLDNSDAVGIVLDIDFDGERRVIVGTNGLIQYQDEVIFRNGFE